MIRLPDIDISAWWTLLLLVIPVGVWVKWSTRPVTLAFGAGLLIGKILERRRQEGRHARTVGPAGWSNP